MKDHAIEMLHSKLRLLQKYHDENSILWIDHYKTYCTAYIDALFHADIIGHRVYKRYLIVIDEIVQGQTQWKDDPT